MADVSSVARLRYIVLHNSHHHLCFYCASCFFAVGVTGASCCNFQLKSLFMKNMLDALLLSTYTLNVLFVLLKCTIPLIFHPSDRFVIFA